MPLLEFALTLLWERQANGKLTHTALAALGGVEGALARYAEEVYLRLPEPDREDAHRLFVQPCDQVRKPSTCVGLPVETIWEIAVGSWRSALPVRGWS